MTSPPNSTISLPPAARAAIRQASDALADSTAQLTKMTTALKTARALAEVAKTLVTSLATRRGKRARKPTLASVSKQASKAGIEVARYEIKSDSINIITGKPEPVAPENPWPLDEFRTKETKQ